MRLTIVMMTVTILLLSCNQKNKVAAEIAGTDTNKIISCKACTGAVCKMPSRALAIQASFKENVFENGDSSTKEMKIIPGGIFQMGSNDFEDSKPIHTV